MTRREMTWVSAWVAAIDEDDPALQSILRDMNLQELELISDTALNLDRQARRVWSRRLSEREEQQ